MQVQIINYVKYKPTTINLSSGCKVKTLSASENLIHNTPHQRQLDNKTLKNWNLNSGANQCETGKRYA